MAEERGLKALDCVGHGSFPRTPIHNTRKGRQEEDLEPNSQRHPNKTKHLNPEPPLLVVVNSVTPFGCSTQRLHIAIGAPKEKIGNCTAYRGFRVF